MTDPIPLDVKLLVRDYTRGDFYELARSIYQTFLVNVIDEAIYNKTGIIDKMTKIMQGQFGYTVGEFSAKVATDFLHFENSISSVARSITKIFTSPFGCNISLDPDRPRTFILDFFQKYRLPKFDPFQKSEQQIRHDLAQIDPFSRLSVFHELIYLDPRTVSNYLDLVDINLPDFNGNIALTHCLVAHSTYDALLLVILEKTSDVNRRNNLGSVPGHYAWIALSRLSQSCFLEQDKHRLIDLLIRYKLDLTTKNGSGHTLLELCEKGNVTLDEYMRNKL